MKTKNLTDVYESIRYATVMLKGETDIPPIVLQALRELNSVVAENCRKVAHQNLGE